MILANSYNFLDLTDLLLKKGAGGSGGVIVIPDRVSGKS
jgi:hypothetical protein